MSYLMEIQRMADYLKVIRSREGKEIAASTVEDWLDVLQELASVGQNTCQIQEVVKAVARQLDLMPVVENARRRRERILVPQPISSSVSAMMEPRSTSVTESPLS